MKANSSVRRPPARWLAWLKNRLFPGSPVPPEVLRARQLIAAVDAGGIPLNPYTVNRIARDLGLEVSRKATVDATIQRIRTAIERL